MIKKYQVKSVNQLLSLLDDIGRGLINIIVGLYFELQVLLRVQLKCKYYLEEIRDVEIFEILYPFYDWDFIYRFYFYGV